MKIPWPEPGLRRISVNSFGFGGANAHVILDDALHYMRTHNMHGFYRSIKDPVSVQADLRGSIETSVAEIQCNGHGTVNGTVNASVNSDHASTLVPRLLVWSAADESAIKRMLQAYGQYYSIHIAGCQNKLSQLAYTLAARRSIMPWRSFAVVEGNDDATAAEDTHQGFGGTTRSLSTEKPLRVNVNKTGIAFVFTGQGAQYAGMGLELLRYTVFAQSLRMSDEIFRSLGCDWSLFGKLISNSRFSRLGRLRFKASMLIYR